MSATLCPAGMPRRRVTYQTAYPASTNGTNHLCAIRPVMPCGTLLPGPPGTNRSVFGPAPHVSYSDPSVNIPLRRPC